jgi:diguanylate cyclase (GGDEF)-like protein
MEDANVHRVRVVVAAGEASCEQVRHVLRRFDWAVEEMPDPEATLRRCQADAPDLLLLDAGLIREGADVPLFEELRQDAGLNDMRILVMAADMEVEQALAGLDLGVDEYLLEPVQQADVAVRLRTAQRLWQLERQILELQADLERIAHTDALTGMYNRRFLAQQLVAQINSARRHGRSLGLLVLDLDRFKQLNEQYGHTGGDAALRALAKMLTSRLRDEDIAGRWGGDEFLVLLPDADHEGTSEVATTICASARELSAKADLSVSVGAAIWAGEEAGELFRRADQALFQAKRDGRGRVRFAPPREDEGAPAREATRRRAVVVDDNVGIRKLLARWLEGTSVEVVAEAADGREALAVVSDVKPDIAIVDLHMPVMDGLACTRLLRAQFPELDIVGFTSTEDEHARAAMLSAGANAHFTKGDLEELTAYLVGIPG